MITDEDVDTFLEHHGIKGMKWGVRRSKNFRIPKTKEQRAARKKHVKIALAVTAVAATAAGAYVAHGMLKEYGGASTKNLPRMASPGAHKVNAASLFGPHSPANDLISKTISSFETKSKGVVRTSTGAIPMPRASSFRPNGKTLIRDLPKVGGQRQIPAHLMERAQAATKRARAVTPEMAGLTRTNI